MALSEARRMARLSQSDVSDFRERLCEAAAQLLVERGASAFTMRELAGRLKVSAMTPYRYFKDKDEILSVVRARAFRRFADRLQAAHDAPGSQADKSAAMGRAYVAFVMEEEIHYRLMFDLSQPKGSAELAREEERTRALMRAHVQMLVEMGMFAGEAELIAKILWAALHGVISLHLDGRLRSVNLDQLLSETMHVIANAYRPVAIAAPSEVPLAHEWPTLS
jgi:AcrR family transcriptional regulator